MASCMTELLCKRILLERREKNNLHFACRAVSNRGNATASTNNANSIGSAQEYVHESLKISIEADIFKLTQPYM